VRLADRAGVEASSSPSVSGPRRAPVGPARRLGSSLLLRRRPSLRRREWAGGPVRGQAVRRRPGVCSVGLDSTNSTSSSAGRESARHLRRRRPARRRGRRVRPTVRYGVAVVGVRVQDDSVVVRLGVVGGGRGACLSLLYCVGRRSELVVRGVLVDSVGSGAGSCDGVDSSDAAGSATASAPTPATGRRLASRGAVGFEGSYLRVLGRDVLRAAAHLRSSRSVTTTRCPAPRGPARRTTRRNRVRAGHLRPIGRVVSGHRQRLPFGDTDKTPARVRGRMQAKREYRDRDETEVAVFSTRSSTGRTGMTVFELRSHVDAGIDDFEAALGSLKAVRPHRRRGGRRPHCHHRRRVRRSRTRRPEEGRRGSTRFSARSGSEAGRRCGGFTRRAPHCSGNDCRQESHEAHGATFRWTGARRSPKALRRASRSARTARCATSSASPNTPSTCSSSPANRHAFVDDTVRQPRTDDDGAAATCSALDPPGPHPRRLLRLCSWRRSSVIPPVWRGMDGTRVERPDVRPGRSCRDRRLRRAPGVHGPKATEKVASVLHHGSPPEERLRFVRGGMVTGHRRPRIDDLAGEGINRCRLRRRQGRRRQRRARPGVNATPFGRRTWETLTPGGRHAAVRDRTPRPGAKRARPPATLPNPEKGWRLSVRDRLKVENRGAPEFPAGRPGTRRSPSTRARTSAAAGAALARRRAAIQPDALIWNPRAAAVDYDRAAATVDTTTARQDAISLTHPI